jgi:mannose-6-phosphate isomerase-like protein (cupin superfamily)
MASPIVSKAEMLQRVAVFKQLTPSSRPLVDAVLPQFHREIFNIIGSGVTEDATMKVPITAVDGFHLSIIKAGPGKGTGLHSHTTVEVFMPLTGTWSVQWGDQGENELTLNQWDVVSVPTGIMRGFRNAGAEEAYMLAIVGGDDPGRVAWANNVMTAVRDKGFDLDEAGKIVEVARRGQA